MALDYELRQEFTDVSLTDLLDTSIASFQGVGDTAKGLLNTYFGITSIGQLANMPQFREALAIQKVALESEKVASTPIEKLMETRKLGFSVRETDRQLTAKQLLDAPVHSLSDLSPSQDLALYDAFRVTSLRQLAHNRIMIEARIIQYLGQHGPEAANVTGSTEEILAMLAGDIDPGNGAGESGGDSPAVPDEEEGELAEHVRSRLDALKDRARERAQNMADRGSEESGADRLTSIRSMREQAAASRAGRADSMEARGPAKRGDTTAAILASRETARRSVTSTTTAPSSTASASKRPSAAELKAKAKQEEEKAAAERAATERAAVEQAAARTAAPSPSPAIQPWMIAAAVAVAVVIGAVIWFTSSGDDELAQSQVEESVVSESQTVAASANDVPAVQTTPVIPPPPPDVHYTVKWGNSLWRISRMHYENPLLWSNIFDANRERISNPNLIFPGQQFLIPPEQ